MVSRWFVALLFAAAALRAESLAVLGDSITAGLGLAEDEAYPALLGAAFAADPAMARWTVVNAGVSGDTSAGGLRRTAWILRGRPAAVAIALGGNDGLRGLPVDALERNLREIIAAVRAAGARPLLLGMRVPRNLGSEYAAAFDGLYPRLAAELDVPLYPFLLDGVAMDPRLNQPDLIHPNAAGQAEIARRLAAWLKPLLAGGAP